MVKSKSQPKSPLKNLKKLAEAVLDLWDALQHLSVSGLYGPVELFDDKPSCVKMSEEIMNPSTKEPKKTEPTINPDDFIGDLFEDE